MPTLNEAQMLEAIIAKDKSYDGQFFYGVITTGVFCVPSCSTRMAKSENMRFFTDIEQAMKMGFRPCKRCNPVTTTKQTDQLIDVIRYIESHVDQKITLAELGKMINLSPSRLQKVFKQQFSISPKTYQDALQMRLFKSHLKHCDNVTDAIYASGFGSASRIYGESRRNIGMTPKAYQAGASGEIISYACRKTSLGLLLMAATNKGICSVQFGETETALVTQLNHEFPKANVQVSATQSAPELDNWMEALDQYISQNTPRPDIPLDIRGTAFQIKVWQFLLTIKPGEVYTYAEVADKINNPKAIRAVGTACGKNSIAVLIPCHRVLRSDGGLGGYRWGIERKQMLLDKESGK